MPSEVVLTRRPASGERAAGVAPSRPRATPAPNRAASASARATRAVDDDGCRATPRSISAADDGPRRAAGAEHDGACRRAVPAGRAPASRLARKPCASVLSPEQPSVLEPERVDGAEAPRDRRRRVDEAKAASLCGMVTLPPAKPCVGEAAQEGGEVRPARPSIALVGAVDAVLAQPVAVDQRRARMRDRDGR